MDGEGQEEKHVIKVHVQGPSKATAMIKVLANKGGGMIVDGATRRDDRELAEMFPTKQVARQQVTNKLLLSPVMERPPFCLGLLSLMTFGM